jgi:hypothetical protein
MLWEKTDFFYALIGGTEGVQLMSALTFVLITNSGIHLVCTYHPELYQHQLVVHLPFPII